MPSPTTARTLRTHQGFHSIHLPTDRDIAVFLPPGYDVEGGSGAAFLSAGASAAAEAAPTDRFPVLYMHDGQNLFDPATAFGGEHWRIGETATALIEAGRIEPLIVVGIYNTGHERIKEYTHTYDRRRGGGEAAAYGRFIVEELKPFIDTTYRTRADRDGTALGGSSLGGLVTLYLGLTYPEVFGKLAVLSPSVWWDRRSILREVRRARAPRAKVWLDIGTRESRGEGTARRIVDDVRSLRVGLIKAGWIENGDLHYEEVEGAAHNERAWGDRFGRALEYLFARP